jgi:hypothetical protein
MIFSPPQQYVGDAANPLTSDEEGKTLHNNSGHEKVTVAVLPPDRIQNDF